MSRVSVHTRDGLQVSYRLEQDTVRVGRDSGCDITIEDPTASREHAVLERRGSLWTVRDCGSRHGTWLNGDELSSVMPLEDGDTIEIGSGCLRFHDDSAPTRPPTESTEPAVRRGADAPPQTRLVGRSDAMRVLRSTIARVALTDVSVLVTGESGTGKELVARLLHELSPRADGPFEIVNCPALPATLLESELFGIERGVATGVSERRGKIERASGGTLFLDEVGDLDLPSQAKLLRFLQDRVVERVGADRGVRFDVRIVAATNLDLEARIGDGTFRRDLYHRLHVVTLQLPPLRSRRDDIPELVAHALAMQTGPHRRFSDDALDHLQTLPYPGNVRELEHLVQSACILSDGAVIERSQLPATAIGPAAEPAADQTPFARVTGQKQLTQEALYRRVVEDGASFWTVVRDPFVARTLPRDAARALLLRVYRETRGSYKAAAATLGIADDYKKFLDFVRYHRLRVRDLLADE